MKKLTTVIMVLSLVLGGVALAAAADLPQTSKNLDLSAMQKISDHEAKEIKGTGLGFAGYQFNNPEIFSGINCQQSLTTVCTPILDQTRQQLRTCK